ncbi:MAG: AAA family ATPase [Proteobacteria bacterium]|nr:AAA family ATPase [Pseudomonadota bacterium]
MYLEYFDFKQAPFSITPDPEFVYLSEKHQESLAHLIYGVTRGGGAGFVQLTGEVGTGKTTISRLFLQKLPENTQAALILNPSITPLELMETIFKELKISLRGITGKLNRMVDRLNQHLLAWWGEGKNTVVIIDEAQNIPRDTLEHLRLLTNLETDQHKLLQIILIGQPELKTLMQRRDLRQLAQRITSRFHLQALSLEETENYINHRIAVSGCHEKLFPHRVIATVYDKTQGTPRLINILCDRALLVAYADDSPKVQKKHIRQAASEVFDPKEKTLKIKTKYLFVTLIPALIAGLIYFTYPFGFNKNNQIPTQTSVNEDKIELKDIPLLSRQASWQHYFSLWNISAETIWNEASCPEIDQTGMACMRKQSNLNHVIHQNSPVILALKNDMLAVMVAANSQHVTLQSQNGLIKISHQELNLHWFGTYFVLWPIPAEIIDDINGVKTKKWALKMATSIENNDQINNDNLSSWVRQFQKNNGLLSDGIIGKETQIALALKAYLGPRLTD